MNGRATFGSLFAGIGGIDLGLERAGWECRFQVEWDPYCTRVLERHWPDVRRFGDIGAVDWSTVEPVDLLAGGFPCQPFSSAGLRRGLADDRWLWPEFARAVRELRPRYVLVENVPGLLVGRGMGAVLGDLAELGFDAEWECIPAAAVGAPHLRNRVWIVAHADRDQLADADGRRPADHVEPDAGDGRAVPGARRRQSPRGGRRPDVADADRERRRGGPAGRGDAEDARESPGRQDAGWWDVEPDVGRVANGVPARVDRLRGLGNAVVPQVVEPLGRLILADMDR